MCCVGVSLEAKFWDKFIICAHLCYNLFLVVTFFNRLDQDMRGLSTKKNILKVSEKFLYKKSSSLQGCLPLKVAFRWGLSSIKSCLQWKVVFNWRLSSIEGHLPSKVVFHKKVIFIWRSSSIEGRLPSGVVFHQRLPD